MVGVTFVHKLRCEIDLDIVWVCLKLHHLNNFVKAVFQVELDVQLAELVHFKCLIINHIAERVND